MPRVSIEIIERKNFRPNPTLEPSGLRTYNRKARLPDEITQIQTEAVSNAINKMVSANANGRLMMT